MKFIPLLLTALLTSVVPVQAQPSSPIKIFSSFPAGSGPDVLARVIAKELETASGQPVVVDNRPGGNGAVALAALASDADKQNAVVFASNDNLVLWPTLSKDTQFIQQTKPLTGVFSTELMLASSAAIVSSQQLAQEIKKTNSYGSWGMGSAPHVLGLQLAELIGHDSAAVHAPYRSYGDWFSDLMAQRLTFSFVTTASTFKLHEAGRLSYHAVTSAERNPRYPHVPTMQQLFGQDITADAWAAMVVHQSMAPDKTAELQQQLSKVLQSQVVVDTVNMLQYSSMNIDSAALGHKMQKEQAQFVKDISKYQISIN